MGEWHGLAGVWNPWLYEQGGKNPCREHECASEDGVRGDDRRAVAEHEFFAEQDPAERGDERGDYEQVSGEGWSVVTGAAASSAEYDQACSQGGSDQREPACPMEPLTGEDGSADCEQHRHGADHKRGVADGGARQAVELEQKLYGDAKRGGDEEHSQLICREAHPVAEQDGKHAKQGKQEAIEHHIFHAHLIEREAAEVETGAPYASREGAGSVSQPVRGGLLWRLCRVHSCFYSRIDVSGGF